eukprot:gene8522-4821_t
MRCCSKWDRTTLTAPGGGAREPTRGGARPRRGAMVGGGEDEGGGAPEGAAPPASAAGPSGEGEELTTPDKGKLKGKRGMAGRGKGRGGLSPAVDGEEGGSQAEGGGKGRGKGRGRSSGGRGRGRGDGGEGDGGDGGDDSGGDDGEAGGLKHPVLYVRLDPGHEWLCSSSIQQTETMWATQLEHSKEVVAQSLAVRGLGNLLLSVEAPSQGAVSALASCLCNKQTYCRIRVEAGLMLGVSAAETNNFAAEHLVLQSVPLAVGQARDSENRSPQESYDLIVHFLDHCN